MKNEIQKDHMNTPKRQTKSTRKAPRAGTHHRKIITAAGKAAEQIGHPDAFDIIARVMTAFGSKSATVTT